MISIRLPSGSYLAREIITPDFTIYKIGTDRKEVEDSIAAQAYEINLNLLRQNNERTKEAAH